jgi:deoxyhypusine synthase
VSAFSIASLGGLAALLRSRKEITLRNFLSAILSSGLLGLCIALTWFTYYSEKGDMYFVLGVSGFAGVGGMSVIDFLLQVIKNGGIDIVVKTGKGKDNDDDSNKK